MRPTLKLFLSNILKSKDSKLLLNNNNRNFVPKHEPVSSTDIHSLENFLETYSKVFVITGAGISTESGIPDYRSEGVGLYSRTNHRPMKIQEFLESHQSRQKYWARNFIAWPTFSSRQPNQSHFIIRDWEKVYGKVHTLVTQNVDGLHLKAGSSNTIELHGTGSTVICLQCDHKLPRDEFQTILQNANPNFTPEVRVSEIRPDGDIHLDESEASRFNLPSCQNCNNGILKPDVVFFGDNVKKEKVEFIYNELKECDSILVLGSTLQVFSSLRFILRGKDLGLPIAIVSLGPNRADNIANLKINARLGEILPKVRLHVEEN